MTDRHDDDYDKELLALRLYGELDPAEERALATRVAESSALQAYAAELEAGLGAVLRAPRPADLPAGWHERLRAEIAAEPSGRPWLGALVGFAAGVLVTALLLAPDAPTERREVPAFRRAEPPPPAATRGAASQLASYVGR